MTWRKTVGRPWRIRVAFRSHGKGEEYLARSREEALRVRAFLRSRHPTARITITAPRKLVGKRRRSKP